MDRIDLGAGVSVSRTETGFNVSMDGQWLGWFAREGREVRMAGIVREHCEIVRGCRESREHFERVLAPHVEGPPDTEEAIVARVIARVSDEAAAWLVRHGHFGRIDRDPSRYFVANWMGHADTAAESLARPLTPDESAALEACIRARLSKVSP